MPTDYTIDEIDLTNQLMDQLLEQAYQNTLNQAVKTATTPIKPAKPLTQTTGAQQGQTTLSDARPVVVAGGGGETAPQIAPSPVPSSGPRMSKAERIALETAQYHNQKDASNQDILSKALLGAGVLGVGALLGRKSLKRGYDLAKEYHVENEVSVDPRTESERLNRRPAAVDPRFWTGNLEDPVAKAAQQERLQELYSNPLKTVGAAAYRLGMDVVNDGTRSYYWRYNHPLAMLSDGVDRLIDPAGALSAADKRALAFTVAVPAIAAAGAYDPMNPTELFRPAGMKQNNPSSENPRESTEPATELFQRFFMGRTGRPLAYAEAKKDIPDLTPERYGNYLRFAYQDKGPLGLGLVKATGENLEGVPEARVLGYPVTIPMVTIAGLGAAGAGLMNRISEEQYRTKAADEVLKKMEVQTMKDGSLSYLRYEPEMVKDPQTGEARPTGRRVPSPSWASAKTEADLPDTKSRAVIEEYLGSKPKPLRRQQLLLGLAGAGAGVVAGQFLGNFINNAIASSNNTPEKLPTTQEYGVS